MNNANKAVTPKVKSVPSYAAVGQLVDHLPTRQVREVQVPPAALIPAVCLSEKIGNARQSTRHQRLLQPVYDNGEPNSRYMISSF